MDTGQDATWGQRVPPPPAPASDTWTWAIARPAELTAARSDLRRSLRAGCSPDDVDRLLLAFEELASNGLRHSGAPVEVRVGAYDQGWLIDVSDSCPEQPPRPAVGRDPALGGLGLHLVARLSSACGWAVDGSRKHVWAVLLPDV
jgi:anti-sigma regulatory factor (Ser/Thr protein kinase)